jgi:Zn-dependent protease with chaperone function
VLILGVVPGGPAARAGLQAGDYLETLGPRAIARPEDLAPTAGWELRGPTPVRVRRGETVVEASVEPDQLPLAIEFQVAEDDAVDALATPGTIALTTGMLRFLRSDDELAVVVGHELAHVVRRHTLGRVALNVPSIVFGVLAAVIAPGSQRLVSNFVERVVSNLAGVALSSVERNMEREADIDGLFYAQGAGYDPRAAEEVWERFSVELPRSMKTSLFAVHPPSSERLLRLRKVTEALLEGMPKSAILEQATAPRETPSPSEPEPSGR